LSVAGCQLAVDNLRFDLLYRRVSADTKTCGTPLELPPRQGKGQALYNWLNLRIWLKIRVFWGWLKFVSGYVKRDKKKFEKFDFYSYPPAHLVDFQPRITRIHQVRCWVSEE
jgi:hypothetical protein